MDNKENITKHLIRIPKDFPNAFFLKRSFLEMQSWQLARNIYITHPLHANFFFREAMHPYLD
jgi:hypothetical protein